MPHTKPESSTSPVLIIIMGVSGSGKSSVAQALAQHYQYHFYDADDFHSNEAKALMAAGTALSDEHRAPWVHNISAFLTDCAERKQSCTLAFSGLRHAHRDVLRQLPFQTLFLHLEGSKAVIGARMNARSNHFMPTSLLDSQFDSLEPCENEQDIIPIDISKPLAEVIHDCKQTINAKLSEH
ncbi:AAA family ATPase [Gilvimarinus agarilyticus]|uniref:gluconokinase n=1 Tax=unclassified Gilvimarinus TaxID=2642066 RepID=UPI001C0927EA|nr:MULTISPECIES: gluconokinase, GntK/IdnK-type [unclassified Gilvimarinus]MBU2886954.1 AAA family ATPase [Gilvimarinus agarilyticus]MDO6571614.1 gluconokinase, GntK/IdnK-type [Gilvimarinus sp. 2_MG-2023]MDO6747863.1 gluconokinase, GntK/IdnK-type [Gilvimarinus sp. 1_MG-2023]